MKLRRFQYGVVGLSIVASMLLVPLLGTVGTSAQSSPVALEISRFKISTGSQFVELYNSGTDTVQMSSVQLVYYNNWDITKATSSKIISLSGELAPGSYYLINDSQLVSCYLMTVASASLGFSTTAGMVQLINFEQQSLGGPFTSKVLDSVAWSRSATSAPVHTLPPSSRPDAFLQKTATGWQEFSPDALDPCEYVQTLETPEVYEDFVFLGSTLPPVRYVAATATSSGKVNRNIGKMAPIVNELLPNPAAPQTDADDEFIEIYNPNGSTFDLSGFKLAFGSNNPKKYTFPEGTVLQLKEFKAFTSGDTSISLSNTQAQVWLLDPNEKVVHTSEPYAKAGDGKAWALDSVTNKWVWTSKPTPGQMNAITPETSDEKAKTAAATLGITSNPTSGNTSGSSGTGATNLDDAAPLHPSVLALVGMAAVGYALYEYRQDIANRIFQFRRYIESRKTLRKGV